jgi:hypothetical protein
MSNSGKVWDIREAYKQQRNNAWEQKGDLGFLAGGTTPSGETNVINKVQVSTNGNAVDYADLTVARGNIGGNSGGSFTRGIYCGGTTPSNSNVIDYITYTTTGNAVDFGDMSFSGYNLVSASDSTRLVIPQGDGRSTAINYLTIASQGNSASFGTLTDSTIAKQTLSSPTRLVCAGGTDSPTSQVNTIQYLTIQTLGNASDFGDLNFASRNGCANSNGVRGLMSGGLQFFGGGDPGNSDFNNIDFFTIASTGNATDFGDLNPGAFGQGGVTNGTRALFAGGGSYPDAGTYYTSIQTVDFNTTGNTTDFGDLSVGTQQNSGSGNGQGGLLSGVQRPSVTYMPGSGRVLFTGGQNPSVSTSIDMTMIKTKGNSSSFGTLATGMRSMSSASSLTRSLSAGGYGSDYTNAIRSVEFASQGNDSNFGDLIAPTYDPQNGVVGNTTRGIFAGGHVSPTQTNVIQYVTIASVGNATDFGDLSIGRQSMAGMTSNTRGVFGGGTVAASPYVVNTMEYITIASTGDVSDFGDLSAIRTEATGLSSSTRGIIAGGDTGAPSIINIIEYITIASTGNTTDFGDLTESRYNFASGSDSITGIFAGGSNPSDSNVLDFITIASTGNAADFGDITSARRGLVGTSDSHGGLQSS